MHIFSAFWRKFRRKSRQNPSFPLNRLPYTLRAQIFSNFEHDDAFKVLKTSRELRHYVLNHGLLPRKIKDLRFYGINPRVSDGSLLVEDLKIIIYTVHQTFSLEIGVLPKKRPKKSLIVTKGAACWAFRKLAACQNLAVHLDYAFESSDLRIDIQDFLQNPRFLDGFSLFGTDFELISPILSKFSMHVFSHFTLDFHQQDSIPECHEFSRFFHRNLKNCARIDLIRTRLEASSFFGDTFRLQTTNLERLLIGSSNEADFRDFTAFLLDNHLLFRGIVVVTLNNFVFWNDFEEISNNLRRTLGNYEKIEDPETREEIFARFADNSHDVRVAFKETTYYRRRISEDRQVFYILLKCYRRMRLQTCVVHAS